MKRALAAVASMVAVFACQAAWADGGLVVLSERADKYQISVLVSPAPPRVGPADLSVLVQDAKTGEVIDGLAVTLRLTPDRSMVADEMQLTATRAAATNKLFYAAPCEFPSAGRWKLVAEVGGDGMSRSVAGEIDVAGPAPRWQEFAPWIAWPAIVVGLFLARERLVCRQRERRSG